MLSLVEAGLIFFDLMGTLETGMLLEIGEGDGDQEPRDFYFYTAVLIAIPMPTLNWMQQCTCVYGTDTDIG